MAHRNFVHFFGFLLPLKIPDDKKDSLIIPIKNAPKRINPLVQQCIDSTLSHFFHLIYIRMFAFKYHKFVLQKDKFYLIISPT